MPLRSYPTFKGDFLPATTSIGQSQTPRSHPVLKQIFSEISSDIHSLESALTSVLFKTRHLSDRDSIHKAYRSLLRAKAELSMMLNPSGLSGMHSPAALLDYLGRLNVID
jgi:hypothetical protein